MEQEIKLASFEPKPQMSKETDEVGQIKNGNSAQHNTIKIVRIVIVRIFKVHLTRLR